MNFKHLNLEQRDQIEYLHNEMQLSQSDIAHRLNASQSTICRELRKGYVSNTKIYSGMKADSFAYEGGRVARKPRKIAIDTSPKLYNYVIECLKNGLSPELIAGKIKLDYPNDEGMRISSETIYRFIYSYSNRGLELWKYLYRHRPKRQKKLKGVNRYTIKNRVSIHNRPRIIEERGEMGHFEGDSIVGKRGTKAGIRTEVERSSRMVFAKIVPDLTAYEGIKASYDIFNSIPKDLRISTTYDNGHEHFYHYRLNTELGMDTYFADPYSSYQRGTNERKNRDIRYFYPKGTDFSKISEQDLEYVVRVINNRPMKVLGYRTPQEVWNEKLSALSLQN